MRIPYIWNCAVFTRLHTCAGLSEHTSFAQPIQYYSTMQNFRDRMRRLVRYYPVVYFLRWWMDGWLAIFTSFSTVFQSYQDDGRLIMKGCVQRNSVYGWEDFASNGDRTRSARSVSQCITYWATGTLFLRWKDRGETSAICSLASILNKGQLEKKLSCSSGRKFFHFTGDLTLEGLPRPG